MRVVILASFLLLSTALGQKIGNPQASCEKLYTNDESILLFCSVSGAYSSNGKTLMSVEKRAVKFYDMYQIINDIDTGKISKEHLGRNTESGFSEYWVKNQINNTQGAIGAGRYDFPFRIILKPNVEYTSILYSLTFYFSDNTQKYVSTKIPINMAKLRK
ncbi:hypothetical protein [Deinococcus misasensis]|uniref:hypothetical protein n=1 Tax=Deinococcus misasensis TaxID=392413 RepID=UPI000559582A|nr:hypothetical protein [Deinococcus misasensis]